MEKNNTGKYIKYALGEIVLVVIGILIALQINNWNEERKINGSIKEHLIILKNNLHEDQFQLRELEQIMNDNVHYSDSCMMQIKTLIPVDNKTTKFLGKLMLEYQFKPNKNAIETITQSNELPFFPADLQTAILDYYALIESVKERESISNNQIQSKYEVHINEKYALIFQKDNEWSFLKSYYKDDPREVIKLDVDDFLSDKKLEALVTSRYFQSEHLKNLYAGLLDSSTKILKMLDEKSNQ